MKHLSKLRFRAASETTHWTFDTARGRVNGQDVAVLLRNASIISSPPSDKREQAAGNWSDNCKGPSRIVQDRGNVKVLTKEKCQVLAERNGWSIERAKGFVDGETCRARGKKPSKYALIGIDDYSLGFRAGYYERRNGTPRATDAPRTSDSAQ